MVEVEYLNPTPERRAIGVICKVSDEVAEKLAAEGVVRILGDRPTSGGASAGAGASGSGAAGDAGSDGSGAYWGDEPPRPGPRSHLTDGGD